MKDCGFEEGAATPCISHHKGKDLRAVVHGEAFTILGPEESLQWLRGRIEATFEVKLRGRRGPDPGDCKSIRILNRIVSWTDNGIQYEADQRHEELIIKMMGLDQTCKSRGKRKTIGLGQVRKNYHRGKQRYIELQLREGITYHRIGRMANLRLMS